MHIRGNTAAGINEEMRCGWMDVHFVGRFEVHVMMGDFRASVRSLRRISVV